MELFAGDSSIASPIEGKYPNFSLETAACVTVLAYLHVFLVIEPSQQQCQIAVDRLISLLQSLGFTINWSKVVQPSQSLWFLGVEMDTVNRVLQLPRDRVSELLKGPSQPPPFSMPSKLLIVHGEVKSKCFTIGCVPESSFNYR